MLRIALCIVDSGGQLLYIAQSERNKCVQQCFCDSHRDFPWIRNSATEKIRQKGIMRRQKCSSGEFSSIFPDILISLLPR